MSQSSLITILNSEFNRSIDDTIVNRLANSLFCNHESHEEFWKNIDVLNFNCFFKIMDLKVEELSHPNLIKVVFGIYYKYEEYHNVLEDFIKKCLSNGDSEYKYVGLWCVDKLLGSFHFTMDTVNAILDLYISNRNVIFESILQDIMVHIYSNFYSNSLYKNFRKRLVNAIFENISEKVYNLKNILEHNIHNKYCFSDIELRLRNMSLSHYRSTSELFYCYSLLTNTNQVFELELIKLIESMNEKDLQRLCKKFMYLTNGEIIEVISSESILGKYLWNLCIDRATEENPHMIKSLLSVQKLRSSVIPKEVFENFIIHNNFDNFNKIIFGTDEINIVCSYFIQNDYQHVLDKKTLIRNLFNSMYYEKIFSLPNSNCAKTVYSEIFGFLTRAVAQFEEDETLEFYIDLVADTINHNSLNSDEKLDLLQDKTDILLTIQNLYLERYLNSVCLEILSTRPIQLANNIILIALQQSRLENNQSIFDNIIKMIEMIMGACDFYDAIFSTNLLYCLLAFCPFQCHQSLIGDCVLDFVVLLANRNSTLDMAYLSALLPSCFHDNIGQDVSDGQTVVCSLLIGLWGKFKFRKCCDNLSMVSVRDKLALLNHNGETINLLDKMTFTTEYCQICQENIGELIDDIVLSCKPLDCFGD